MSDVLRLAIFAVGLAALLSFAQPTTVSAQQTQATTTANALASAVPRKPIGLEFGADLGTFRFAAMDQVRSEYRIGSNLLWLRLHADLFLTKEWGFGVQVLSGDHVSSGADTTEGNSTNTWFYGNAATLTWRPWHSEDDANTIGLLLGYAGLRYAIDQQAIPNPDPPYPTKKTLNIHGQMFEAYWSGHFFKQAGYRIGAGRLNAKVGDVDTTQLANPAPTGQYASPLHADASGYYVFVSLQATL